MNRLLISIASACLIFCCAPASAQSSAEVVTTCGTPPTARLPGAVRTLTQNTNGQLCGDNPTTTVTGTVAVTQSTSPWVAIQSSQYPSGATPITASATGTTGATTATLAGTSGKTTYLCSMSIRSNATAAATGNATVTGTITGTLNFTHWTAPLASGIGITEMIFSPCVPASAANTGIAIISSAPGAGGVVSSTGTGYQL